MKKYSPALVQAARHGMKDEIIARVQEIINEGFKKPYGEKISLDGFKAIEVDSEILYAGSTYVVIKNDGVTLHLKPAEGYSGKAHKINFAMFNQAGAIRD